MSSTRDILTPDLGVESAEVIELMVQAGDSVTEGQSLLLVESAKASVEIPSPATGTLTAWKIQKGQTVKEGVILATLDTTNDSTTLPSGAATSQPANVSAGPDTTETTPTQTTPTPTTATQTTDTHIVVTPDLGVDSAEVTELLVQTGATVTEGQSLLLVESAKASVEIPSPFAGEVGEWRVSKGQSIQQGMPLMSLRTASASSQSASRAAQNTASPAASSAQTAESVSASSSPVNSPAASSGSVQAPANSVPENPATSTASSDVYAGPAVRRLARQLGVALSEVSGSGPHQRLLKEDVYSYVKQRLGHSTGTRQSAESGGSTSGLPPLPDMSAYGPSQLVPLSRIQQAAIRHLANNRFIPQVTQFDQADITELEALRQSLKDEYKQQGINLTILAFIAKAVAYQLRQVPRFNSHLTDDQSQLLQREDIHLGIAVATEEGLVVPVLRQPDGKGILQIATELQQLGQKARDKKLLPADFAGASFTISSLGNLGGTGFTPLVNWPQVAILGVSPASLQPVWEHGAFQPRLMLPLSLSYDHRVINGADAAVFARQLAENLKDIRRILL